MSLSRVTALGTAGVPSLVRASSDIQRAGGFHSVWGVTEAPSLEAHHELLFVPVPCWDFPCSELLFLVSW